MTLLRHFLAQALAASCCAGLASAEGRPEAAASGATLGWETEIHRAAAAEDNGWATRLRSGQSLETSSLGRGIDAAPHALGGLASYYWQGEITASGEPFDKRGMTAAHRTLPFGTNVRVTNLANGRSAVVRINDRGPFKAGRVIDVSEGAADLLGMRQSGVTKVKIDILDR